MTVTREQVWSALAEVFDPENGMSIVELGLVYGIDIHADAVQITITLTTMGCPLHHSIPEWARKAIMHVPGVGSVDVKLTFDPPWSPDRIQSVPDHTS
jgi:metal-sulfur cluster biosynthetic enzyme